MKSGFSLIEVMFVVLLMAVLTSVAIPMYADYSKKSRTSEIPALLKSIVQLQVGYKENPDSGGNYATGLETLMWLSTTSGDAGNYYNFGTQGVEYCDPAVPIGLAEAWAINPASVPDDWVNACMDIELDIKNSP
jgi:prepilin-type N-terminal cleavage/methylation domain-containing protein